MEDDLHNWEVEKLKAHGLDTQPAQASFLPAYSGDGYGYGGGSIRVKLNP